jgi:hypothetical protein
MTGVVIGDQHFMSSRDEKNLHFEIANFDFSKKRRAPCGA